MATLEQYTRRVQQRGSTYRERDLYYEKRDVYNLAINSLSCKDCIVNGNPQKLVIDDGTLPYYKDIKSLPDESFNAGNYVEWADGMWLIVSCDWDKEVYTYGKMQQCNYYMRWQDNDKNIIDKWAVVLSASKYNNGELYNNIITVGSNQLMVYLPLDDDTKKLGANKRLFVDFNTTSPKCYEITRIDTVTMAYDGVATPRYDGVGCVLLVLTESEFNPDTDNVELMLCDYVEKERPMPTAISFKGSAEIRIGGRKTFECAGATAWDFAATEMWCNKITLETQGEKCVVKIASEPAMVGAVITLTARMAGLADSVQILVKGGV